MNVTDVLNVLADHSLLVNGSSTNAHVMQQNLTMSLSPAFSPVKTRRMRQDISSSVPHEKSDQTITGNGQSASKSGVYNS